VSGQQEGKNTGQQEPTKLERQEMWKITGVSRHYTRG